MKRRLWRKFSNALWKSLTQSCTGRNHTERPSMQKKVVNYRMSLVRKRTKRVFEVLGLLAALGLGLTPVWAEENQPTVDTINFYGLRTVTEQQLRAALGIREGEPAPLVDDLKELAKRLEKVPHVARAKL